jgi:hypothetical protein
LASGEANVGQRAIIQVAEMLARARAFAPKDEGRDKGGPHTKPLCVRRRHEEAKGVWRGKLRHERHLIPSSDTLVSEGK